MCSSRRKTHYLALVRATFSLRGSLRKPMPWCSLALTQDRIMKSFSRPWKASTLAISTSFSRRDRKNKTKHTCYQCITLDTNGRRLTISNITITNYFYKYLKTDSWLSWIKTFMHACLGTYNHHHSKTYGHNECA